MALLSDTDRAAVRDQLSGIAHPVKLLFFSQTIAAPETALLARQIIDEVASLNERISVEEVNFVLDRDRAAAFGVEQIPAIAVLRRDEDTRIRFLGAPAGYEFVSLIDAIRVAGGEGSGLADSSRALIAQHVSEPLDIQVFVTPT